MIRSFTGPFAALIMLVSVVGMAPASAEAPVVREKFGFTEEFYNEAYSEGCGVDVLSVITLKGQYNEFADGTIRVHENATIVHTNPATNDVVYETWAATYRVDATEVFDEETGLVTIDETVTTTGQPWKFRAKGVGTIVRDAGTITFHNLIVLDFSQEDDPLVSFDQEILHEGGPHPLFDGINDEEGAALCSAIGA